MDWSVWLIFVLTEGALTLTPGPAVLLVVAQGLRFGSAGALRSAAGILAANTLYFAISGTGVGALLAASGPLYTAIRWAGALYLLFLGGTALLRAAPGSANTGPQPGAGPGRRAQLLRGFILQISNPKALLFFVAILPQFIDPGRPFLPQILVLGATSIALESLVLAAYGTAAARSASLMTRPRFAAATSRVSGALLIGAALGLLGVRD